MLSHHPIVCSTSRPQKNPSPADAPSHLFKEVSKSFRPILFKMKVVLPLVIVVAMTSSMVSARPSGKQVDWNRYKSMFNLFTSDKGGFFDRIDQFIDGDDIQSPCWHIKMANSVSVCHGTDQGDYVRSGCQLKAKKDGKNIERTVIMSKCPAGYPKCGNVEKSNRRSGNFLVAKCCEDKADNPKCKSMAHNDL